jgi:hypothetical protein
MTQLANAADEMSVEAWFDKYGVEILKREAKRQRMAKLLNGIRAKAATA